MTIPSSGQSLSFSALRTEFVGGSSAISLGDLYRGGSNIRAKHPSNPATNDAANVPESGALDVSDFYDQGKGFTFTYSSGATDQNLSDLFGSTDYGVDYPKNVVIPASITLGTNNTSEYALEADSGGAGTITITNNGNIIGAGGAGGSAGSANGGTGGNGSAGGDAFKASVAVTLINNGSMLAGGGGGSGGGGGGQGGNLQQQSQGQQTGQNGPFSGGPVNAFYRWSRIQSNNPNAPFKLPIGYTSGNPASRIQYGPAPGATAFPQGPFNRTSFTQGQYTYYRGPQVGQGANTISDGMDGSTNTGTYYLHSVYRQFPQPFQQQTQVAGHAGGAGGAGGLGRGFNNQPGGDAGASGSAGSTGQAGNGGAGGNGGTGGGYGSAGGEGQNGSTGTSSTTSGSSGGNDGSVGAAGKYIEGISNVTFTNNGTVAGGTE